MSRKSLKLVVVGPTCAGKTSITKKYESGTFSEAVETTVGSGYSSVQHDSARHATTVRVELWDTAGQERHRSLAPFYLRNAAGALLVFEKGDRASFEQCVAVWLPDLLKNLKNSTQFIVLVANKSDLPAATPPEEQRALQERVEAVAREKGLRLVEASAKTGENVKLVFETLIEDILASKLAAPGGVAGGGGPRQSVSLRPAMDEERDGEGRAAGGRQCAC